MSFSATPCLSSVLLVTSIVAHASTQPTLVPHWAVLVVSVLGLWALIGGGVVITDRVLMQFSDR